MSPGNRSNRGKLPGRRHYQNSAAIVIPARYGSSRFPGKPLAVIRGVPMIVHVYRRAAKVLAADTVIVATDDKRIALVVSNAGGRVAMTSRRHRSGTSRVWEVASRLPHGIIVNVQGDEPLLPVSAVGRLIESMMSDETVVMATLATPLSKQEDWFCPDVVKVVCDRDGNALYFSRSPIPSQGFSFHGSTSANVKFTRKGSSIRALRHIGVYAFRRDFLRRLVSLPPGRLEKLESLEQLRAMENGYRIKVLLCRSQCTGVDRPADLKRIELALRARKRIRPSRNNYHS